MADFSEYKDQKVVVVTNDGDSIEGTVEEGSEMGVVLKPKNSSRSILVEAGNITSVDIAVAGVKGLKARNLPQVNDGKNRLHLTDRHGYAIADVNKLSENEAKTFHDGLDHTGLGHFHREESPVDAAIKEAEDTDED